MSTIFQDFESLAKDIDAFKLVPVNPYSRQPDEKVRMDLELRIDALARKILTTSHVDNREGALQALVELRGRLVCNQSNTNTRLNLNLVQNIGPTPLCPYYNKYQVPTISSYQVIGGNLATIRLDPSAVEHVPPQILEKVGDLSGKSLDLFSITVDGRPFADLDRPINLCTHPWSHPHLIKGKEAKADTNMGIFPVVGFQRAHDDGAIAMGALSPMEVYAHIDKYSPDNAHFTVIPDTPYGIFWAVTEKGNRVAISKMIVLFDYKNPVCQAILQSIGTDYKKCLDATDHAQRLGVVREVQAAPLIKLIEMFKTDDEGAMKAFEELPPAFRYGIYEQTWKLHKEPKGVHGDFGRVSFHADGSINLIYRSSNAQRAEAVEMFLQKLDHELVGSQLAMMQHQRIAKGDNVLKFMACAQLLNAGQPEQALKLFEEFTKQEKEAVYLATWETIGCPHLDNIGALSFHGLSDKLMSTEQKVEALLLAASRQQHVYEKPLVPPVEVDLEDAIGKLDLVDAPKPLVQLPDSNPSSTDSTNTNGPPVVVTTPPSSPIITPTLPTTVERIREVLYELVYTPEFENKALPERAVELQGLLAPLSLQFRNVLYGYVYNHSDNPSKGGPNWGENHVGDDINVLMMAFEDAVEQISS